VKAINLDSLPTEVKEIKESVESKPIGLIQGTINFASSVDKYDFILLLGPMMQMTII
jgi:hypothetical protein